MKTPLLPFSTRMLLPVALACLSLAAGGCAVEHVYLQDLRSDSPVVLPPVYVVTDSMAGTFRISPRVTFNTRSGIVGRIDGHSPVSTRGMFEVDSTVYPSGTLYHEKPGVNMYTFNGKNLTWNTPKFQAGLDMEYAVSDRFALTGCVELATSSETDFLAMGAGMALLFGSSTIAGRLDAGILYHDVASTAQYVITSQGVFGSATDVFFRTESRKDQYLNLYGSFTLNTHSTTSLVNGLLSVAVSGATLASLNVYSPTLNTGGEVVGSVTLVSVSPGIFIDLGKSARFLTCVRFVIPLGVDDSDPSSFIMPMAKIEFSF